jgi:hypothetical protein
MRNELPAETHKIFKLLKIKHPKQVLHLEKRPENCRRTLNFIQWLKSTAGARLHKFAYLQNANPSSVVAKNNNPNSDL